MTVIINEVEVVVEQPTPPPAANGADRAAAPPTLQPLDVAAIVARQAHTRYRLSAH